MMKIALLWPHEVIILLLLLLHNPRASLLGNHHQVIPFDMFSKISLALPILGRIHLDVVSIVLVLLLHFITPMLMHWVLEPPPRVTAAYLEHTDTGTNSRRIENQLVGRSLGA
jgi:hypothetical protein